MKFKLMIGQYIDGDRLYRPGDIIENSEDLCRFNGSLGMTPKFERVPEHVLPTEQLVPLKPPSAPPPPRTMAEYFERLEQLSDEDLRQHAADEELDLQGAQTKSEIIGRIRAYHEQA